MSTPSFICAQIPLYQCFELKPTDLEEFYIVSSDARTCSLHDIYIAQD